MSTVREWAAQVWEAVAQTVGAREFHVYGGLVLIAYGLAQNPYWPAIAYVFAGGALFYLGAFWGRSGGG